MDPFLLIEREGAIVTLRMNRPEQRNALTTPEQMAEFSDACADIQRDISIKAVILTGNGTAFSAGGNVKDMRDKKGVAEGSAWEMRNRYRRGVQRIPMAFHELEVPVVAAINGPAIGLGLDLACMCDIRIASETAIFALSFVRLGIIPGDGGAWLLPRVIGMPRATIMALTGESIDAKTAMEWGLVTDIVPPDALYAKAKAMADRLAVNPAHSLRLTKRLLREGQHMQLGSLLEMSAAFQGISHHTQDHAEAVAAFVEKRPASFVDR